MQRVLGAQAVLHHMASPARRLRVLGELARVLRPGGRALLTVWASEQEDARKLAKCASLEACGAGRWSVCEPSLRCLQPVCSGAPLAGATWRSAHLRKAHLAASFSGGSDKGVAQVGANRQPTCSSHARGRFKLHSGCGGRGIQQARPRRWSCGWRLLCALACAVPSGGCGSCGGHFARGRWRQVICRRLYRH